MNFETRFWTFVIAVTAGVVTFAVTNPVKAADLPPPRQQTYVVPPAPPPVIRAQPTENGACKVWLAIVDDSTGQLIRGQHPIRIIAKNGKRPFFDETFKVNGEAKVDVPCEVAMAEFVKFCLGGTNPTDPAVMWNAHKPNSRLMHARMHLKTGNRLLNPQYAVTFHKPVPGRQHMSEDDQSESDVREHRQANSNPLPLIRALAPVAAAVILRSR
ncbi:MAG TPA: hypothetical protein VGP13_02870 [Candidatus Paceibacterota bacterium]|jgi:hypothetical protein|nr:hypothetical protein [Candidatus Paceibacterota bacterium]